MSNADASALLKTPLHGLHESLGGKMVPFAGYDMPVQYPMGILKEHLHCRAESGLFDVSHMGQAILHGADAGAALERLVPGDLQSLTPGAMRYTQFTNARAGILDDLMITRMEDHWFLVVNAARKAHDFALLRDGLPGSCALDILDDRALIAVQGPKAAQVLARLAPEVAAMRFMTARLVDLMGVTCRVSRSGYTGEDGYEISVPAIAAVALAERLLSEPEVAPVGLGARDSLRLEAGLCLYGSDIDETTTPVEAGLLWSISKRRRAEGGFPGDAVLRQQIAEGPSRRRVGLRPDGKAPARAHTEITDAEGAIIGEVTSGGFGPTVGGPVAMGYVPMALAEVGSKIGLSVRGKILPGQVSKLPFVEQRYFRG
ncbi:glycine cleavage system aminomethyltransferase GcvT [Magnetospira thiophila]